MRAGDGLAAAFVAHSGCVGWAVDAAKKFRSFYGDPSRILGKPAAELEGRTLAEALDSAEAALWARRVTRALEGESLVVRHHKECGEWVVLAFPIRFEGAAFAGVLTRHITDIGNPEQGMRERILSALKSQELERRMAAQFLHDKIGQNLTALGLQLDLVRMDLPPSSPEIATRVAEVQKILETVMEEVRRYSYELDPSMVERAGLRGALERLASRTRERFNGVVRVNADPSLEVENSLALALYCIAQQAVENAAEDAACSAIEIAVKSTQAGPCLEVRDNGRGFDPADIANRRGSGLLAMERYAAQVGLDLSIRAAGRSGAIVRATFPED